MKKQQAKDQEKFVIRLPNGMRERIKAKADRAEMSMNEAIVWCLEQHFPAPKTLDAKLDELAEMVAILKGNDTYKAVDRLTDEIHDALVDIYDDKLEGDPDFKKAVERKFDQWTQWQAEQEDSDAFDPFDDNNYPKEIGGIPYEEVDWDAPVDPENPMAVQRKKKPE
ncbi:Arc family DNA-binding protein [Brucella pituitosa]|uniref:Arc family DNA-binding protein n=1 Tax=Brucella pituitosa TaxID=571256 RepID=UPI002002B96B|nr:Arc family DNA-binding protein [Brucella pituitosa]MCK4207173.1 Arc family DNA-binding protein [Brucella pituitosa]